MRMEDVDAPEPPGQVRPSARNSNADDLGEDLADDAADVEQSGGSLAEGAGDVAQGVGDAISAGAEGASDAIAGGAEAAEGAAGAAAEGLAEAAAATSWIPFVGEILGAAAAATGLAAAGYGVYEEIAGGAKEAAAEKIPGTLNRNQLPSANLAGGYIAPVASSVAV